MAKRPQASVPVLMDGRRVGTASARRHRTDKPVTEMTDEEYKRRVGKLLWLNEERGGQRPGPFDEDDGSWKPNISPQKRLENLYKDRFRSTPAEQQDKESLKYHQRNNERQLLLQQIAAKQPAKPAPNAPAPKPAAKPQLRQGPDPITSYSDKDYKAMVQRLIKWNKARGEDLPGTDGAGSKPFKYRDAPDSQPLWQGTPEQRKMYEQWLDKGHQTVQPKEEIDPDLHHEYWPKDKPRPPIRPRLQGQSPLDNS